MTQSSRFPLFWRAFALAAFALNFCVLPQRASAQMFQPGEVLEYEVSYIGILLGTIKMTVERVDTVRGHNIVKARADIDTAPGIPFVEFHSVFETWMDASAQFSHQFLSTSKTRSGVEYTRYDFLFSQGKIRVEEGVNKTKHKEFDFLTPRRWNDGLSLFFFAREFVKSGRYVSVPTAIINFRDIQRENVEIKSLKNPVKTLYFKGEAKWKGIYGLEKDFEGWFSDDEARVPIRAKMKVIIGKVDIQLVRWKRANWSPPQAL